jgi:short-subunit dehydrogenase
MSLPPRSILITGASSGIGEALALSYADDGAILTLSGRDEERLRLVAEACVSRGGTADARVLDVRDQDAMERWIRDTDSKAPLDLVIANAGIARDGPAASDAGEDIRTREMFEVNLNGVINTVLPAVYGMRARRHGQIAIVSSIAGYRGIPGSPAYAASKAAVKSWGEGLRGRLAADGIRISVICPGFVSTRMTSKNHFPMPFLMNADQAARIIRRGLEHNRPRITFPLPMAFLAWLAGALPPSITDWMFARMPRKE